MHLRAGIALLLLLLLLHGPWADSASPDACAPIERVFRNVTAEEPACHCFPEALGASPEALLSIGEGGAANGSGGGASQPIWIGCTRQNLPAVFRELEALGAPTAVSHLWIWDSLVNILPNEMFAHVRPRILTIENSGLSLFRKGAFDHLPQLRVLRLKNNIIKSIERRAFSHLQALQSLDLSVNKLAEVRRSQLEDLHALERLTLADNKIAHIEEGSFASLANLRTLSLANNRLTNITSGTFRGLNALEELSLQGNELSTIAADAFAHMKRLRVLHLGGNRLTRLQLRALPSLQRLYLNANNISRLGALQLQELPALAVLNVDRNRIERLLDGDFASLNGSAAMSSLSLADNGIALIECNALAPLRSLRVLALQSNRLTSLSCPPSDEPILVRSVVWPLVRLRSLFLSHNRLNQLEDSQVNVLPALSELSLDHNNISELGANSLRGLNLTKLFLNNNRLYYLPEGLFGAWDVSKIRAVDLAGNMWECICGREWVSDWLATLGQANTPSSSMGCLPRNCKPPPAEGDGHPPWVTVVAALLAVVALVFMATACYVYMQENCRRLNGISLRNLPPDMMRLIPSQESLLLSFPNPSADLLLKHPPAAPMSPISITATKANGGGEQRTGGPVFQDSSWLSDAKAGGEKKRVRFDGI